jgi:hypothetical protein
MKGKQNEGYFPNHSCPYSLDWLVQYSQDQQLDVEDPPMKHLDL